MMNHADIVVIGGGIGGCLAAHAAASQGKTVILTESNEWLGGQFSSQGVPADEHPWIDRFGSTKSYREFRQTIREQFKKDPSLKPHVKSIEVINPGNAWVGEFCVDPRTIKTYFEALLQPWVDLGRLRILKPYHITKATMDQDLIQSVQLKHCLLETSIEIKGTLFIDATETGDLLPLSKTPYVTGAESIKDTGEKHAPLKANPKDMQATTWVAACAYCEGESHIIEKPKHYDYFKSIILSYDPHPLLSWYGPDAVMQQKRLFGMFGWPMGEDGRVIPCLFPYRRVINGDYYLEPTCDVTLINWPQNDYSLGNIFEDEEAQHHLNMAKQQTLSLIYWLQTEAPRHDGGVGYPELKLRGDILGTDDGLAQAPYIRESRRIQALKTIKEQDISLEDNDTLPHFDDSVGIGSYKIDMHMTTQTKSFFYYDAWPFQIPLGSLIPQKTKNLLAGSKNIGTTHLTNSCYRLHPVEWNIGESAGFFAAYCLDLNAVPQDVYMSKKYVETFQEILIAKGIELVWPEEINAEFKKKKAFTKTT